MFPLEVNIDYQVVTSPLWVWMKKKARIFMQARIMTRN